MIILLGGISCTGKTLMAQRLLEKYKVPYLSIDHLKMGIFRSGMVCGFTPSDDNYIIGEKLWSIVKGIIMTNIENNQHIIIEGCYLLPHLVKDFVQEYLNQIITIFIGFTENYIKENFSTGIKKHRNIIETRALLEDRSIDQFISEHIRLREQCKLNELEYVEIDNNYDDEIKRAYELIEGKFKW